jgi:hypothetical protein
VSKLVQCSKSKPKGSQSLTILLVVVLRVFFVDELAFSKYLAT